MGACQGFPQYFKNYLAGWIATIAIYATSAYMELTIEPFKRRFHLTDPAISYPYAEHQRVTSAQLWFYAVLFPYCVMFVAIVLRFLRTERDRKAKYFHLVHVTTLSFLMALAINGFVTEYLKLNIGKMRPDFLARCGPSISVADSEPNKVYDESICTMPLGQSVLNDGFKSDPSGHSSFAWCGFNFLNLWLSGQFQLHSPVDPDDASIDTSGDSRYHRFRLRQLVNLIPLGLALRIAISRSEDYRHDFIDIAFGSFIGFFVSTFVYSQFFRSIFSYHCQETKYSDYKLLEEYDDLEIPPIPL